MNIHVDDFDKSPLTIVTKTSSTPTEAAAEPTLRSPCNQRKMTPSKHAVRTASQPTGSLEGSSNVELGILRRMISVFQNRQKLSKSDLVDPVTSSFEKK